MTFDLPRKTGEEQGFNFKTALHKGLPKASHWVAGTLAF